MCGRTRCTLRAEDVPRACYRTGSPLSTINTDRYRPSYNVSPGSYLPVLRRAEGSDGDGFLLHSMRWGLIPSFTHKNQKPDFYRMFNARSESVSEKASFRRLLPKNRCLVAVEGFYEWKKDGSKKQPYFVHFKDSRPLVFAALFDSWQSSEGEILYSFTVLTTSSSSSLQWLHDRMPVILSDKESTDMWLNGSSSFKFDVMLKPYEDSDLVWYPVTPAMGKTTFDGPECIKQIQLKTEGKNPISKFFVKKEVKKPVSDMEEKTMSDDFLETNKLKGLTKDPIQKIKEEKEPDLEQKNSGYQSDATNQLNQVKQEPMIADKTGAECTNIKKECDEAQRNAAILPSEEISVRPAKRGYEEFVADSSDKSGKVPAKKGNLKDGGGKQPSLFSYFAKK